MSNKFIFLLIVAALQGCDQGIGPQIEKCVEAAVKIGEPFKNQEERNQQEARARFACLEAAAGKN